MATEFQLIKKIGDRAVKIFGDLEKRKEKELVRLAASILDGDSGEKDVQQLAKRFNINSETVASFIYFELMKRGINDLGNHDMWIDDGRIIGKRMIYDVKFVRYGIPEFSKHVASGVSESKKFFDEAEQLAQDFDLGETEINLARKERKRVEKRLEIHDEIQSICENFENSIKDEENNQFWNSSHDKLDDLDVQDIRSLLWDMEERNELDPMASPSEAMGHASWAPEYIGDASEAEKDKLKELVEKRREMLGSKAEKLDALVEELEEIASNSQAKRDKEVIDKYQFAEKLES